MGTDTDTAAAYAGTAAEESQANRPPSQAARC